MCQKTAIVLYSIPLGWSDDNLDSDTNTVGSTAIALKTHFPTTFCIYFLSSGERMGFSIFGVTTGFYLRSQVITICVVHAC